MDVPSGHSGRFSIFSKQKLSEADRDLIDVEIKKFFLCHISYVLNMMSANFEPPVTIRLTMVSQNSKKWSLPVCDSNVT